MDHIVILTGAGISAESGLGTFRDKRGVWSEYDLEDVATPQGFARDPAKVHDFYNARRANLLAAHPHAGHSALARLARSQQVRVTLITQNIDNLHERAGSPEVVHMHGELMRALCHTCGSRWDAPKEMQASDRCPVCGAQATRPDVVWFGEIPYHMDVIETAIATADQFVAIGTSGQVWPAAGLAGEAAAHGAKTREFNLERSELSSTIDDVRLGPASETLPLWVDEILGNGA